VNVRLIQHRDDHLKIAADCGGGTPAPLVYLRVVAARARADGRHERETGGQQRMVDAVESAKSVLGGVCEDLRLCARTPLEVVDERTP
jgi:hypothetical protein